jgi:hypothetical protein
MIRLPVSGLGVTLRLPGGEDELALIEGPGEAVAAALALLTRLTARVDGQLQDWAQLPVTDFEFLLLRLRETLLGDHVSSLVGCPSCAERVEISFRISDYIARIRPAALPEVTAAPQDGWLQLETAQFRLPRVADVLAAQGAAHPGRELQRRCLSPGLEEKLRRRLERVIAKLAPQVTGEVGGACPACGALLAAWFDVPGFVLTELRRLAAGIHAEVHLLATHYGWAEAAILALPGARRRAYAELIRDAKLYAVA